jgi:hypothetical protein
VHDARGARCNSIMSSHACDAIAVLDVNVADVCHYSVGGTGRYGNA